MSRDSDNLLTILHGWATQQDENFTTDAFAHLLRQLLSYAPNAGVDLINWLTGKQLNLAHHDAPSISIQTQVSTEFGRPDIEIRTSNALAYVEVKVEAGLGNQQLHRYLEHLTHEVAESKVLVLLTRYPEEAAGDISDQVVCRRWYQVSIELEKTLKQNSQGGPIFRYLIEQFVGFLKERGMTIDRVTWEMTEGVKAFRNLMEMLRESIQAAGWKSEDAQSRTYSGYNIKKHEKSKTWFYIGCNYNAPSVLRFRTEQIEIVPNAVEILKYGELLTNKGNGNHLIWLNKLQLDSEEVHFFALSRERQLQTLERFVMDSITAALRVQISLDQDSSLPTVENETLKQV